MGILQEFLPVSVLYHKRPFHLAEPLLNKPYKDDIHQKKDIQDGVKTWIIVNATVWTKDKLIW